MSFITVNCDLFIVHNSFQLFANNSVLTAFHSLKLCLSVTSPCSTNLTVKFNIVSMVTVPLAGSLGLYPHSIKL